ncbi:MAG: hypothetical protein M3N15_01875 [Actinomycetota bacterium]|nr:hypothetical protein [Actinomycetota bacterium]
MSARHRMAAGALAVVVTACFSGDELEPLPVPSTVSTVATTPPAPADHSGVVLPPVEGTTTTAAVVVGPGAAVVAGRVDGPDGPVEGATVRLERLVGDAAATLDVGTGPDGTWRATGVLGGRYRVRAWRRPDLASVEPQLVFVAGTGTVELALRAERFGTAVEFAVAPNPPVVGEATNVLVRVAERTVDADGAVRARPRPGVGVSLAAGSGWAPQSPLTGATDEAGTITFTLVCRLPGPQGLLATVLPDQVVPVEPLDCVEPPPVTTTSAPPGR